MKEDFRFDLQLFADDDGGAPDEGATAEPDGAPEGAPDEGAAGGENGTILGGNPPEKEPAAEGAPDAYDFKGIVPEGMEYDEESAAAFGEIAKKVGLSQEQASEIASYGIQYMRQGVEAAMQAIDAQRTSWAEDARKELGGAFQDTVAKAAAGRDALATKIPGLVNMLNETGAGNRIEMIRLMAAVGELVGEDGGDRNGAAGTEKSIYPNTDFKKYN
ncbi:hypothetical protein TAMA11512_09150 [Selenomonas sp. TAMA-11512]|uniref:hypothetical protein n=1 Tax=Selenomonas sp. TAMA-11512 TaxID=3095337 RepID=UPI003088E8D9|nr:hypothetical protein TAMA11512_09150 [Selenomonas sp. TAMA-11512]